MFKDIVDRSLDFPCMFKDIVDRSLDFPLCVFLDGDNPSCRFRLTHFIIFFQKAVEHRYLHVFVTIKKVMIFLYTMYSMALPPARSFAEGKLGLAYTASGHSGGVCEKFRLHQVL
jgi:hypothetical protein